MNDYADCWILNGTIVNLRDYGRGQPNGVATLDENGGLVANELDVTLIPAPDNSGSLYAWILSVIAV